MNQDQSLLSALERIALGLERLAPPPRCEHPPPGAGTLRWSPSRGFMTIPQPRLVAPEDLLGVDRQRRILLRNTRQLIAGQVANHVLLWGARGTGKSSLIRSLPAHFPAQPLRLVEIDGGDLRQLPELMDALADSTEATILFADDLSFRAEDPSYTALKALLDGSLAAAPAHVRIYASSNRRHLMPEAAADNQAAQMLDGELHPGEAVEEKISLSERFGIWLAFHPFTQAQYLDCVHHWLQRLGVPEARARHYEAQALRWALSRGARNGRVAYQFAVSQLSDDA